MGSSFRGVSLVSYGAQGSLYKTTPKVRPGQIDSARSLANYYDWKDGRLAILRGLATNGDATEYQAALRSIDGEAKALCPLYLTVS